MLQAQRVVSESYDGVVVFKEPIISSIFYIYIGSTGGARLTQQPVKPDVRFSQIFFRKSFSCINQSKIA